MPNDIIKIKKQEFDNLHLINNNVAIEIVHRNSEDKTASGLVIVQDPSLITVKDIASAENYNLSQHLDRWGKVAKIPDKLKYAKHKKIPGMDWDTDIEIQVGDLVWADYYNLHHCPIFRVLDDNSFRDYWIITYDCLIVAKRIRYETIITTIPIQNETIYDIIPLNGYCLFEQINEGLQSKFLELPKEINKYKGIVKYTGSKNKNYNDTKWYDDIDIFPGDEVIYRMDAECLLEDEQHQFFENENLRYEQRRNILAVKYNNHAP